MRRLAVLVIVLVLMVPLVSATPYWFKEGIYAKYISRGQMLTIETNTSDGYITYACQGIELTWRVLKVTGDRVQMSVLLRGFNCTKSVQKTLDEETAREILRRYQEKYNFTGGECLKISSQLRNVTICENSYSEVGVSGRIGLTIEEGVGHLFNESLIPETPSWGNAFELDLKTGDIYVNGSPVGKNFLWAENPANITGLEILPGLKVENVKMINSTALTYYGEFNAPVYMAHTNMMKGESGFGKCVLLYDGSSGLAIAFFTPFSPLWKVLGISEAMIQDTELAREHEEEIKESNKMPPFGLVLAETNIDFTKPAELPDEGPSRTAIVAVVGIAIVLGVLVLWRWRR
ncbi:hypothetical protein [Thermococcus sp. MAR1]|uniref:hypothetical protein n=1 Tax=Thermococcus sp. MAR1 TaxID=1638263 RepID=UPI001439C4EC|nr:hypothetical protein [Thermococcus sp. MAR1]NJE10520.1 hypothetical protein [Thermococcus sp. MAR1]